jgi:hypothetical protein
VCGTMFQHYVHTPGDAWVSERAPTRAAALTPTTRCEGGRVGSAATLRTDELIVGAQIVHERGEEVEVHTAAP